RRAKIREPIARPEKTFRVDIPIFPTVPPARLGVINDPVLGLAERLHERAMAHAPDLVGLFENRSMLRPGIRIEHVLRLVVQQTQAIIRRPTAAGGIDDENISIALEHL